MDSLKSLANPSQSELVKAIEGNGERLDAIFKLHQEQREELQARHNRLLVSKASSTKLVLLQLTIASISLYCSGVINVNWDSSLMVTISDLLIRIGSYI